MGPGVRVRCRHGLSGGQHLCQFPHTETRARVELARVGECCERGRELDIGGHHCRRISQEVQGGQPCHTVDRKE
eukprot:410530-Prymnesium_polylepis.1